MDKRTVTWASTNHLREVTGVFLELGIIAFGGPAAHVATVHDEACQRRDWVSENRFLDLLGAA